MTRPAGAPLTWADLRKLLFFTALLSIGCLFPKSVKGQTVDRIRGPIDDQIRVRRAASHPLARPEFEAGRVAAEARMERMILMLQPDAVQEQELNELLAAQHDSSSALFHQWLTPEDFGRQFGLSDHDLHQVLHWLQDQGFAIESIAGGGQQIVFSGTAGQVENAFRTELHEYRIIGVVHHANAGDIEIPAALAPVISGIVSLHDFHSRPMHTRIAAATPEYTAGGGVHYVAPGDFATIYDLWPLYGSSTTGSGQSIAVVARSNLNLSDVQGFRTNFGLPPNTPTVIVNGTDPGVLSSGEQGEVTLDAEWAGAVAQSAKVQVVVSASTQTTDGVDLSAQYIINHNLAPIVSVSFGGCESQMGASENQFWNSLWQQAAAQGMSVFVASGDAGAAECDDPSSTTGTVKDVNGLCSSPYSTCVGGTQFNDTATPGAYWLSSNSTTRGSATGYIPETAWNESASAGGTGLWATGGGASQRYSKPSWQSGPGVPGDGRRDVPDVSLASASHDGYLFYLNGQNYSASGTSVATPSFAGLMALIDGRQGGRQGNANPSLYTLAANQANGGSAVFHDITSGNNTVPGVTGYTAGHGYDLITGLGSVDANLLVNAWGNGNAPPPPPCTYSLSAATAAPDASAQALSVLVTASSPSCSWTVTSDSGWIVITSSTTGIGTQTVAYSVAANPSSLARAGTLTIAGLAFTITQAGVPCTYGVETSSVRLSPGGFKGSVAVLTPQGCTWTATTDVSWLQIDSGASGSGSGAVTFTVSANAGGTRRGALIIAGYTVAVTQGARSRLGVAMLPEPPASPQ